MARKTGGSAADLSAGAELDMTSMIDVTFLLIIFFLCVTELADASKEKLELPRAVKSIEDMHEPGRLVINILEDGDVYIQRNKMNDKELFQQLEQEKMLSWDTQQKLPTRAILFRVDEKTPYEDVKRVMTMCIAQKLWKIAFATKSPQ
jgi:biopolymer transport protein ExbD